MAGVYKRPSDAARGRRGKWTCWWIGPDGRRRYQAGTTDRAVSLQIAQEREAEARRIREGLEEPGERARREAGLRPASDHVEDYRLDLLAKGDTPRHARHTAGVLRRLLADASVASVADLAPDRIQAALGRLRATRSPRTANFALGAVRAFSRWLERAGRIKADPLCHLRPYSERVDRRRVRRALTPGELEQLLAAAEQGPPIQAWPRRSKHLAVSVSGPDRAMLYRLAMGTGLRDSELRSLTPESFALEGVAPTVTVAAAYTKNGQLAVQPITCALAARLRAWLAGRPAGQPVFRLPWSAARMLRADLERAGIPPETPQGVVDFHALRHSYITNLVKSGVNPKVVQKLARHSTITLTLDRYTHLEDEDVRRAVEEGGAQR